MIHTASRRIAQSLPSPDLATEDRVALRIFVLVLVALGLVTLARAITDLDAIPLDFRFLLLALLTLASAGYRIDVPGRPVSVGTSEVFVFATVLLFGTPSATLMVALNGTCLAFIRRQPPHRKIFDAAESVVSTWTAGTVFTMSSRLLQTTGVASLVLWIPLVVMTAAYLLVNSQFRSFLVAAETGSSAYAVWKQQAPILGINYYAAATLAALGISGGASLSLAVIGMAAPLLALSYVAHREAATRIEQADRHVENLERMYEATIEALAIAVDVKDQVTHGHIRRVQRHCLALADALGVTDRDEIKALGAAALLHDVGKLCVPDHVLNKPGALKASEYHTMKQHAVQGATILSAVAFPYPVVPLVRHHHEAWNGRGYPDGLSGEQIPFGARILAVVDCFDALTSDRPYRRKLPDDVALEMILERAGTAYDPRVVAQFKLIVPELRRQDQLAEAALPLSPSHGEGANQVPSASAGPASAGVLTTETVGNPAALVSVCQVGTPILARLAEHVPEAEACLFAVSSSGDYLIPAAATSFVQAACKGNSFPIGSGLSGWVAAHRQTIVNSDASLDFRDKASQVGLTSATSTPVFVFGNVVGVLTVYLPTRKACTDRVVRIVGVLAQDAAMELVGLEHSHRESASVPASRVRVAV